MRWMGGQRIFLIVDIGLEILGNFEGSSFASFFAKATKDRKASIFAKATMDRTVDRLFISCPALTLLGAGSSIA